MHAYFYFLVGCILLPVGMIACSLLGHRAGRRVLQTSPSGKELSTGTADAAILSLLGLMIAFTFSSAYARYESRRQLIVQEANAIGTAYLRLDLLPADRQPGLREKFRQYVRSRADIWRLMPDRIGAQAEYEQSQQLQQAIWNAAVAATENETHGDGRKLLLPALNEMIDITTTRLVAVQSHPPVIIFLLLGSLALAAAWIIGFGMAKSDTLSYHHVIGFAIVMALALYVIVDIEYPRFGLVTLDAAHQLLVDLEAKMR